MYFLIRLGFCVALDIDLTIYKTKELSPLERGDSEGIGVCYFQKSTSALCRSTLYPPHYTFTLLRFRPFTLYRNLTIFLTTALPLYSNLYKYVPGATCLPCSSVPSHTIFVFTQKSFVLPSNRRTS